MSNTDTKDEQFPLPEPRNLTRDMHGLPLVPGRNVDKVDVAAGVAAAARFGYDSAEHQMVAEYALMRHRRGEEDGAQRSALSGGIDLTSWRVILASAMSAGERMTIADQVATVDLDACRRV